MKGLKYSGALLSFLLVGCLYHPKETSTDATLSDLSDPTTNAEASEVSIKKMARGFSENYKDLANNAKNYKSYTDVFTDLKKKNGDTLKTSLQIYEIYMGKTLDPTQPYDPVKMEKVFSEISQGFAKAGK